nr:Hint domain-containing protein [uncultured Neokomagataea sp.]
MLVNARSVFYDKSVSSYDYYHVETANHSVIMANGMLTESYLDTGNRSSFHDGNIHFFARKGKSWEQDAAAPLSTSPEFVEPIFRDIEQRAVQNGLASQEQAPRLTQDVGVFLQTDTGLVLQKLRETNGHAVFMLPGDVKAVRIMSRASRPCDIVGAFWDDRRQLGVGISDISIFEWNARTPVTAHREMADLEGWNNLDLQSDMRWTTGNALLPLNRPNPEDHAILSLKIQTVDYIVAEEELAQERA